MTVLCRLFVLDLEIKMISVRLPDGSKRDFSEPVTVAQVAASIGSGLSKAAVAGRVNDKLVDTSYMIDRDVDLAIVTDRDADGQNSGGSADLPAGVHGGGP